MRTRQAGEGPEGPLHTHKQAVGEAATERCTRPGGHGQVRLHHPLGDPSQVLGWSMTWTPAELMPYPLLLWGWHSQGNFGVSSLPLLLPPKLSSGSTLPATPSLSCLPAPTASDGLIGNSRFSWGFCTILCTLSIFPCAQGVHTTPGTPGITPHLPLYCEESKKFMDYRLGTCIHFCSVVSDSLRPAPLSMDFQDKNTGMSFHFLLQGIFPTQ